MKKISDLVVNKPNLIVIISLLLLIPSLISYIFTNVNYDILSYLPSRLDSVKGENILEEDFGGSSMTIVLVKTVDDNGGKISPNTVMKLKNNISEIKNVSNVLWADNIMDTSVPGDILPDDVKNVFYSSDGEYTMMFVSYADDASSKDIIKSVKQIKKIVPENSYLSGISAMNSDTKEMTDSETPIYILIAVALAIITMMITMESYVMPFILVGVIGIAVMYNMGTNFFMGVSYITQSIAAILQLGVTVDYSIFFVNRYNEERRYSRTKEEAMSRALHGSFISLSGSSLTTLFGFLALCFMQLTLGLNIGIVMAKGVIIGVLSVVIILPAFMLVFDDAINRHKHKPFSPDFGKLVNHVVKRKKVFAAVFIIIIIPSVLLSANVKKNYNLNAELPDDSSTTIGTKLLKEKFNMTTSHFIIVDDTIPASKLVSMENEISNVKGVSSMLAYDMFVGTSIPDSIVPDDIIDIVKQNGRQVMLVNSIYESSTDECNSQVEEIDNIVQKYAGSDHYGYVTGEGALYKDLIETTKVDFAVTSIISIIAVFIVIAIVFKSISIPFILILAIEVAIWINQGISTVFGTAIP
ncbi:MAG TPA: antibiotic ABC transporter permease, partial [Ruminococcaceae bacterium]|nr:antibiotic ABC transporter permease [Oscillospiraceae bacterium]